MKRLEFLSSRVDPDCKAAIVARANLLGTTVSELVESVVREAVLDQRISDARPRFVQLVEQAKKNYISASAAGELTASRRCRISAPLVRALGLIHCGGGSE